MRRGLAYPTNLGQRHASLHSVALADKLLQYDARASRFHLDNDLVGLDQGKSLVLGDLFAYGLYPLHQLRVGCGLAPVGRAGDQGREWAAGRHGREVEAAKEHLQRRFFVVYRLTRATNAPHTVHPCDMSMMHGSLFL